MCAASGGLIEFVGARFLQGMGGAMMTPVGRLVLLRSVPRTGLVSAMNWMTIPSMVGPMVGPIVGGFLTDYASWRWIFALIVPIVVATLFLILAAVPPTLRVAGGSVDVTECDVIIPGLGEQAADEGADLAGTQNQNFVHEYLD